MLPYSVSPSSGEHAVHHLHNRVIQVALLAALGNFAQSMQVGGHQELIRI